MGGWARHVRTWAVARAVVRCAAPDGYAAMRHLFSRVDVGVSEGEIVRVPVAPNFM